MEAPQASVQAPRRKWIWATSYLMIALNPIGAASALALIAVWLMEFNWPSAHAWFGKYPATIGLITGLLNLIFTVSLVNRIIERRDELRWRDIRNTTLKGLRLAVEGIREGLVRWAPMMALAHATTKSRPAGLAGPSGTSGRRGRPVTAALAAGAATP